VDGEAAVTWTDRVPDGDGDHLRGPVPGIHRQAVPAPVPHEPGVVHDRGPARPPSRQAWPHEPFHTVDTMMTMMMK
jgi:hypothetical protein